MAVDSGDAERMSDVVEAFVRAAGWTSGVGTGAIGTAAARRARLANETASDMTLTLYHNALISLMICTTSGALNKHEIEGLLIFS
jgi:hypothetical protein